MPETIKQTQLFRFDEMAVQVKVKVEPKEAGVDRYVGLEHIDPESLKIRRWGEPSDVESSKILFRSGDIIFGKRRAYQRKLAVADFDGICSAHAMVLRPKTDVVLEEFLPFFMQSDIFMDRAVKISVGGLSPTINWRDLAKEEFPLPPLEEQRRIVKVLRANEETIQSFQLLSNRLKKLKRSTAMELFSKGFECHKYKESQIGEVPSHWEVVSIEDVADQSDKYSFTGGPFGSNLKVNDYTDKGVRIIQLQNIGVGEFLDDYKIFTSEDKADELVSCNIYPGDLILAKMGDPVARAAEIPSSSSRFLMASDGIRLSVDAKRANKYFVLELLNSELFLRQAERVSRGTTRKRIGLVELRKIPIALPPLPEQAKIAAVFSRINSLSDSISGQIKHLQRIKASVVTSLDNSRSSS
jgi:type I restriction enzyme, S subunit